MMRERGSSKRARWLHAKRGEVCEKRRVTRMIDSETEREKERAKVGNGKKERVLRESKATSQKSDFCF